MLNYFSNCCFGDGFYIFLFQKMYDTKIKNRTVNVFSILQLFLFYKLLIPKHITLCENQNEARNQSAVYYDAFLCRLVKTQNFNRSTSTPLCENTEVILCVCALNYMYVFQVEYCGTTLCGNVNLVICRSCKLE